MTSAVVFDFDGVLVDSEGFHFHAYRNVLQSLGVTLTKAQYYDRYLPYDDAGAFRAMARDFHLPLSDTVLDDWIRAKATHFARLAGDGVVLLPGAREVIERTAAAFPIAIASGASRHEILDVLHREQLLSLFPVVVAAEDAPASKPDPAPYRLAVERLGAHHGMALAPRHCVAIEDSRGGLQSARAAGLRTVAVTGSYSADQLRPHADEVIAHLDECTVERLATLSARDTR